MGTTPPVRDVSMALSADGVLWVFSGDSGGPLADLWSYNFSSQVWTNVSMDSGPSPRFCQGMASNVAVWDSGNIVLVGPGQTTLDLWQISTLAPNSATNSVCTNSFSMA